MKYISIIFNAEMSNLLTTVIPEASKLYVMTLKRELISHFVSAFLIQNVDISRESIERNGYWLLSGRTSVRCGYSDV